MLIKHVILFNDLCIYDELKQETLLYFESNRNIKSIEINTDVEYNFILKKHDKPVGCYGIIKLKGNKLNIIEKIVLTSMKGNTYIVTDMNMIYPFDKLDIKNNGKTSVITTMCKNYGHRLEEWINYNLKLGFSHIIIFNNDFNNKNKLNEAKTINCRDTTKNINSICNKFPGKVFTVPFNYKPIEKNHWNSLQLSCLSIGVNALKNKCEYIATIDADEFIYIPKEPKINIEDYLLRYNINISIKSNILTNKGNEYIDNNVLKLKLYLGPDKFTKMILKSSVLTENDKFITTPHSNSNMIKLDKDEIIHYHIWLNGRYKYEEDMEEITVLSC